MSCKESKTALFPTHDFLNFGSVQLDDDDPMYVF